MTYPVPEGRRSHTGSGFMIVPPHRTRWMRSATALLGAWLAISTLVWPHNTVTKVHDAAVGILMMLIGLRSLKFGSIRWGNVAIATWLLLAAFVLPHVSTVTRLNEVVVGGLVLLLSLDTFTRSLDPGTRGEGLAP